MADSRDRLFWRVLANAATKPLNVLALAGMSAAAILLTPWLLAAAVPVYGLMVAATIKDPKEADRLAAAADRRALPGSRRLDGITGDLRLKVIAALNEERGIVAELKRSAVAPDGVGDQVTALCDEVLETARRATDVDLYLATVDVDVLRRRAAEYDELGQHSDRARDAAGALHEQLGIVEGLIEKRVALDDEIEHVTASLGTVRARLVQTRADTSAPGVLATDVTELRERMRVMAESLSEAYGHNEGQSTMKGT